MSLTILSNFSYNGKNPNFDRDRVATVADLKAVKPENQEYDYGHIVFCIANGKHYRFMYNYNNPPNESEEDAVTGWFKELQVGLVVQAVTQSEYDALANKNDGILYAIIDK